MKDNLLNVLSKLLALVAFCLKFLALVIICAIYCVCLATLISELF